jgi:hypothetical protein
VLTPASRTAVAGLAGIAGVGMWLFVSRDTSTEWVTYSVPGLFASTQETQRIGGSTEIGISLRVAGDWGGARSGSD